MQLIFFLMAVYAYQLFFHDRFIRCSRYCKVTLGVAGGLIAVLCMSFPAYLGEGMRLDLRAVALYIVILYGGLESGLITFCMIETYRAFLGTGIGFTVTIWITLVDVIISVIIGRRFPFLNRRKKLYAGLIGSTGLSVTSVSLICVGFLVQKGSMPVVRTVEFYVACYFTQIVASLMSIYLIETAVDTAKMRAELQRREKMDLIGELAAAMAHEIRNPLAVVRGFLQLSKESPNPMYIDMGIQEIDHADSIIKDYLNFAKPRVNKPERISVGELLENVADSMSPYATMENAIVRCTHTEECYVEADRTKFKQAMMNLVKNGIEAQSKTVELQCELIGTNVQVTVKDTGIGMTREQIERIGQPFYSTKAKGTGLGLMVTMRLIEAMNGKAHFESVQGAGTVVKVSFRHATCELEPLDPSASFHFMPL